MEKSYILSDDYMTDENTHQLKIRVPKRVATVKVCGAINLYIDDTMDFIMPTEEQRKNLKEMLCIEVIPSED
jgi:hypothetical protein